MTVREVGSFDAPASNPSVQSQYSFLERTTQYTWPRRCVFLDAPMPLTSPGPVPHAQFTALADRDKEVRSIRLRALAPSSLWSLVLVIAPPPPRGIDVAFRVPVRPCAASVRVEAIVEQELLAIVQLSGRYEHLRRHRSIPRLFLGPPLHQPQRKGRRAARLGPVPVRGPVQRVRYQVTKLVWHIGREDVVVRYQVWAVLCPCVIDHVSKAQSAGVGQDDIVSWYAQARAWATRTRGWRLPRWLRALGTKVNKGASEGWSREIHG